MSRALTVLAPEISIIPRGTNFVKCFFAQILDVENPVFVSIDYCNLPKGVVIYNCSKGEGKTSGGACTLKNSTNPKKSLDKASGVCYNIDVPRGKQQYGGRHLKTQKGLIL